MPNLKSVKIALATDLLTQLGGAERVLVELLNIFPQAPLYTLIYDSQKCGSVFGRYDIRTSCLQKIPGAKKHYKKLLFLYPRAIESLDFKKYDLIISLTSALIKGIKTEKRQIHICYCNTPTRYIWTESDNYLKNNVPKLLLPLVKILMPGLKKWDYNASQRPDYFIANSREVQKRIRRYYQRDSKVIYPPVEVEKFKLKPGKRENYYLMTGRLVAYKKYNIVISAFNYLFHKKLIIAGEGPERKNLEKLVKKDNIQFLGRVSDKKLAELYQHARGYIFPALEDFGITPLEAMSCGTPVLAYGKGGTLETVKKDISGLFFMKQTPEAVVQAVKKFERMKFNPGEIRRHALNFSSQKFRIEIKNFIGDKISKLN